MKATTTILAVSALLAATLAASAAEVIKPNIGEPLRDPTGGSSTKEAQHMKNTKNQEGKINKHIAGPGNPVDLGEPLRSPSICRGADGVFYLTGVTKGRDPFVTGEENFDNCLQLKLWKSEDLKKWHESGVIIDLTKEEGVTAIQQHPQGKFRPLLQPDGSSKLARGITSPELHFGRGTFWLCFAMNDITHLLFRSVSGKPEGPYTNVAIPTLNESQGPSFFADGDESLYALWRGGTIVKLAGGLEKASAVKPFTEGSRGWKQWPWSLPNLIPNDAIQGIYANAVASRDPFVFRHGKDYCFLFSALTGRGDTASRDVLICNATTLQGPYSNPSLLIPNATDATVFSGANGSLMAVYTPVGSDTPRITQLQSTLIK